MARLEITAKSEDFTLAFTYAKWNDVWKEADTNVGAANLKSFYRVIGAEVDIAFVPDDTGNGQLVVSGGDAFFFDNVGYDVWLEFGSGCSDMAVTDESKSVEDLFTRHKNVLTGRINFNNDIGRSDFSFRYRKNGQVKSVTFTFEVLSTKLDYHKDWQLVFNDVERKYPMLAADYLRRTYHAFDREPKTDAPTPDLIWWNLFKEEQAPFIKACELVVSCPRRKLHPTVEYRRADQLRRLTPALENEFAEHRTETARLYRVEREDMSHDTVENRFVKYAIRFVTLNYDRLVKKIDKEYGGKLSETEKDEMTAVSAKLKRLCNHPFFRDVGRFTGLRQESSILQRAPGYSMVWRTFGILNASYMLYNGSRRLQTKNIADLYEIWCFLKVEEIVRACCADWEVVENYQMLNDKFVQQLDEGEESSIIFKKDGIELAKLVYNLSVPYKGIGKDEKVFTPTSMDNSASQKPDIVLRLTKDLDGNKHFKMTYLFDAKYRIGSHYNQIDYPPQDALDQMHRYRDAIYFGDSSNPSQPEVLKREVIGGYILFPGAGQMPSKPQQGQKDHRPRFLKSIDNVNIGAFPLRPGNADNIAGLQEFIKAIIDKDPEKEVVETIAQKGTEHYVVSLDMIVRDVPLKGVQKGVETTGVCPGPMELTNNPKKVKWIVLPRPASMPPIFAVKEYVGIEDGSVVLRIPHFADEMKQETQALFSSRQYHVWKVEPVKLNAAEAKVFNQFKTDSKSNGDV